RDFWKRWHITLSKWLMDHLFIPLYKYSLGLPFFRNHPLLSQNLALSLTFVLVSIWAGFKPLYLLCGIIIGVINSSHNLYVNLRSKNYFTVVDSIPLKIRKFLSWFLTIHSFLFAFYIFSGRFPYLLDYNQDKLPPIIRTETSQVTQDNESTPRYNLRNSSIEIEYDTLSEIYYKIKTIKTKGPITLNQSFDNSFILIDDYQNKYQIDLRFSAYFKLREEFYGRSEVVNIPISKLSSSGLIKLPLNNYTIDNIKVFKKDKNELWSELTKFNSQSFIHLGQLTINHEHLSYRILIFEKHFFPININLNGKFREINLIE
ncbi:MAG: hypothetical protein KC493_14990, partial [Bacteriovoracaceae bacterium]|nr:hypothetical protein [Bacteriovoracaceae bacterium]